MPLNRLEAPSNELPVDQRPERIRPGLRPTPPGAAMPPKLSVITVCYNGARFLEQTILSVVGQTYPNLEYVIIDGGSTDGTHDILSKHDDKITRWISEPDQGIADAMNKGLALATGELVMFLHADDYLTHPSVLQEAVAEIKSGYDVHAFPIYFSTNNKLVLRAPRCFGWRTNFKLGTSHQGILCPRDLFREIGLFDPTLRILMDYDFFLRAYRRGKSMQVLGTPLSVMRDTGISSRTDWPSLRERFVEEKRVHKKNASGLLQSTVHSIYWSIYMPYRRIRALVN